MCNKAETWQEFYLTPPDSNCDHPPHTYTLEDISKFDREMNAAKWRDTHPDTYSIYAHVTKL